MTDIEIRNNEQASRYEAVVDGDVLGYADYTVNGDTVDLTHTKVEDAAEGKGVGSALAKGALEDIRAQRKIVQPSCPFIRGYIDKHPQFAAFVAGGSGQGEETKGFNSGGSF